MAAVHGINVSALAMMYKWPFHTFPDAWQPKSYVVVRIHPEDFEGRDFRGFKDLKPGCAAQVILQALASIVDRKDMGKSYKNSRGVIDPYYCAEELPKTIQILEEIVDKENEDQFRGFHLWIFANDETYNFGQGFSDLVSANARRKNTPATTGYQKNESKDVRHLVHQSITSIDDLAMLWTHYLQNPSHFGDDLDQLHTEENAIYEPESQVNPCKILTAENAFRLASIDVCEEQVNLETYFITDDGISASTFRRVFPKPERTYRILTPFFSPESIYRAPVPSAIRQFLSSRQNDVSEWTDKRDTCRRQLDLGIDDDQERADVEYQYLEAQENRQRKMEEMEDIARNVNRELTEDQVNLFLSTPEIEAKMAERNEFMKLAKQNKEELEKIQDQHTVGTPEYEQAMIRFRKSAIKVFWHTFMTSENITPAAMSVRRWFKGQTPQDQWFENNQITKSLSPYGNMIVRIMCEFDKVLRVETNFSLAMLALGVKLCAYRFSWSLRPNLLLTGEGASGKSFILDMLEQISVPGTTLNATHITTMAFQTDQDMSDITLIIHEMPPSMIGIDRYGNEISADPYFKNRLTKQMTITIHPVKDSDTRKVAISVNRCMGNTMGASNDKLPSTSTPIMQRFLKWSMTRNTRIDTDPDDMTYMMDWASDEELNKRIIHRFHLQDFYVFAVEKAIESNALPDVDVGIPKTVAKWVFKEMASEGVPAPQRRHTEMLYDICRVMCIYYAVEMEFFSELGTAYREDRVTAKPTEFKPEYLCEMPKWFVCTQEMAVHVLTTMEAMWIPKLKVRICKAIANNMVTKFSRSEDSEWIPSCSDPERGITGTEFKQEFVGNNGDVLYDYQYIQVCGENLKTIASRIQVLLNDAPSVNDIMGCLIQMQFEFIHSYPKEWIHVRIDSDGIDVEDYFLHDDLSVQCAQKLARQDDDMQDNFMNRCTICEMEFDHTRGLVSHIRTWKEDFLRMHYHGMEPVGVRYKRKFVENRDESKRVTPCAIVDESPLNKNKKRVCIAIDIINKDFDKILKTCIPRALEHAAQGPVRFITSFPYSRNLETKEDGARNSPELQHTKTVNEVYCNVFDTIDLRRIPKHKIMANTYSYSACDIIALYNRVSGGQKCGLKTIQKCPGTVVDAPLDFIHFGAHWLKHGIPERDGHMAYPPITKKLVWEQRDTNPRFHALKNLVVDSYPEDWIAALDEKKKELQTLRKHVDIMDAQHDYLEAGIIPDDMPRYSSLYAGDPDTPHVMQLDPFIWDADADAMECSYEEREEEQESDTYSDNSSDSNDIAYLRKTAINTKTRGRQTQREIVSDLLDRRTHGSQKKPRYDFF